MREESTPHEIVGTLGKAYQWEKPLKNPKNDTDFKALEKEVEGKGGDSWKTAKKLIENNPSRRRALVLIYAHLLRLPISKPALIKGEYSTRLFCGREIKGALEQAQVLLQTPSLLNALLNISLSRNWLHSTLWVMRLQAHIVQALLPGPEKNRFVQLPGIKGEELPDLAPNARDFADIVKSLEEKHDSRAIDVKKAVDYWGRLEVVDASFKGGHLSKEFTLFDINWRVVIGERIVAPQSIVFLLVKLRIVPPTTPKAEKKDNSVDETKRLIKLNDEKDIQFLTSKKELEELPEGIKAPGYAHAPYWPAVSNFVNYSPNSD